MPYREITRRSVTYQGTVIRYTLRRSKKRRKTLQFTVGKDGVLVAVPHIMPIGQVKAYVLEKAPWILKQLKAQKNRPAPRKFVTGETMPYLGRNLRLTVERKPLKKARVRLNKWRFFVDAPKSLRGNPLRDDIRKAFLDWYQARAAQRVESALNHWSPQMGLGEKSRILIGNQKTLWGSCAPDDTLRFNWRLVMMPPRLMEYVVVHELAHLKLRNHAPAFWEFVNQYLPDAKQRRLELKEQGHSLPL